MLWTAVVDIPKVSRRLIVVDLLAIDTKGPAGALLTPPPLGAGSSVSSRTLKVLSKSRDLHVCIVLGAP